MLAGLTAIDAGGPPVGMVRVEANDPTSIGKALDAGAAGVIVPLVNTAEDAAAAVAAAKYPPMGDPLLRADAVGAADRPEPGRRQRRPLVLAMIETPQGLANVEEICRDARPGRALRRPVRPRLAVGGAFPRPGRRRRVRGRAGARRGAAAAARHRGRDPHRPPARSPRSASPPGLHLRHRRLRPHPPRSRPPRPTCAAAKDSADHDRKPLRRPGRCDSPAADRALLDGRHPARRRWQPDGATPTCPPRPCRATPPTS